MNKIQSEKITAGKIDATGVSYDKELGVFYPTGQKHLIGELYLDKKLTELKYRVLESESDE